ncbi:hypothetical protein PG996_012404 [Apiospora saccharicola]|uniref:Uncharacterized protein n=1 Tax=Apiospora saccharicola TaxID=335842 RepID=A0ABR1U577_9PEZI
MAACLPLTHFLRKPRPGDAANSDNSSTQGSSGVHGQHNDLAFTTVTYHIQTCPPVEEQDGGICHNCDYIDASQQCVALPKSLPGFLVELIVEDPAQPDQQTIKLVSPCWKRVADAVKDITFVAKDAATDQLMAVRPRSYYKVTILVPQSMSSRLTGNADINWGAILSAFAAQGYGMNMEILVERGPDRV